MSKQSKLTLLIDGNWLLMSRFAVLSNQYSDEELCKQLQLLMLKSINLVLRTFPEIDNIIFVSDGGSWRGDIEIPQFIYDEVGDQPVTYKGQRHLSDEFNWTLIFQYYEELINELEKNNITTCKAKNIEGDDWCWYWSRKLNKEGTNCIIWSMDKDLNQLVNINKDDGIFTVCWDSKTGLKCPKIINNNENPLDFFFNDLNKEYNNRIFQSICDKCTKINEIEPKEIIINKIIRGDAGDNIFPIILKKSNKIDSIKKFRVSQKDLDFNIDLNNDEDIKGYIHNILTSKKYLNKVNKSEENIFEHFKYNYKLIVLDKKNYPKDILENMNSYSAYYINKDIQPVLSYYMANINNIQNILENI